MKAVFLTALALGLVLNLVSCTTSPQSGYYYQRGLGGETGVGGPADAAPTQARSYAYSTSRIATPTQPLVPPQNIGRPVYQPDPSAGGSGAAAAAMSGGQPGSSYIPGGTAGGFRATSSPN